jgi:hypothetical protein
MESWYGHCGYATLEEYNEALMDLIVVVSRMLSEKHHKSKFEIVPPGFYPHDTYLNLFANVPI